MNWKEITLKKGKELWELDKDNYYASDPIGKFIQQLCIVLDKEVEWVENLPLAEINTYQTELKFLTVPPKGDFDKSFKIDDIEYEMIDLSKMSFGEWVDLDSYCKDVFLNLEKIMAVLYRPKGEKYDSYVVEKRWQLFLDKVSYETAAGAALFFSLLEMESIKNTKDCSLLDQMMTIWKKYQKNLEKDLQSQTQGKQKQKKRKKSSSGS